MTDGALTRVAEPIGDPPPPAGIVSTPRERWTPIAVSATSTIVVFGLMAVVITSSPTWPAVRNQFFSLEDMRASFPDVLEGFWLNIRLWLVTLAVILVVALVLAVMRSMEGPIATPFRWLAIVFIDAMRGIPSLLLVVLFGFGVPALQLPGLPRTAVFWGSVALVASYAAYTAEVYRSGIEAVHTSQRAAAKALGLSQWQAMRHAVLPQAVRNVAPALLNLAVALQKDISLLSVIGVREALREASIYKDFTFNYSSLVVAAVLFLLASVPLARLTDWFAARDMQRRTRQGG